MEARSSLRFVEGMATTCEAMKSTAERRENCIFGVLAGGERSTMGVY